MTTITKKIDLNVSQPNNYQLVHAMQGDSNTVEILVTIWNGNKLYSIDCDQVSLEWQSPSGGKRDYPIHNYTQHTATFLLTKEMLAENGDYAFCLRFENSDNDVLRTFCSTMRVMEAPFGQLMDSEIVTLTELINEAKNYKEQAALSATNAENSAKQAQSYAIGTGGARPNESTDSSKYYYEQVKDIFQGLSDSFIPINTVTNGDFDNVIKTGFYKMIDSSHAPTNNNIHSLLVCDSTDGLNVSIQQIAIPITSNTIYIRYRRRISLSTVQWSEWVHIPYSAVDIGALPITGGTLTGDLRIKGDGNYGTKINLGDSDYVHLHEYEDDKLEIKGTTIKLSTNNLYQNGERINLTDLKKSVSDGKSSIASAITAMGVSTASDAAFATMSSNIRNISKDASAQSWDINEGKTAYSNGQKITGTLKNHSSVGFKFMGATCKFPPGVNYMIVGHSIDSVSYKQFGLHYTINTNNLGSVEEYSEWNCPCVRVTGAGIINVLRSNWSMDVTNYCKMYVTLYGKSSYVGSTMEFRGCVGVCVPDATSSTGGEGRDYVMSYAGYTFNSVTNQWLTTLEVDLSWISREVRFHMSTVHAGVVYVNAVTFVPNAPS